MTRWAIADAGALVAFLDQRESQHAWTVSTGRGLGLPWLTCEAAFAEAWYLLRRVPGGQQQLLTLAQKDLVTLAFSLADNLSAVAGLVAKYGDVPISLADACLVRMAELYDDHAVFTLDADFGVYRKHGDQPIPLVTPGGWPAAATEPR
ncbi:MAG: PIN domain-containing protein [Elusimicrobia bacterium]|nr:PIN domain-containing protein [Elusimicrobiota bacterium]